MRALAVAPADIEFAERGGSVRGSGEGKGAGEEREFENNPNAKTAKTLPERTCHHAQRVSDRNKKKPMAHGLWYERRASPEPESQ